MRYIIVAACCLLFTSPVCDFNEAKNAMTLAQEQGFQSIAFPLIGAGSGSFNQDSAKEVMLDDLRELESPLEVTVVVFRKL